MAKVRYVSPYDKITGTTWDDIEGNTIGEVCQNIILKYGDEVAFLLDDKGDLSKDVVILVDRRGALTLDGFHTAVKNDTEVIIMEYLGWA